MKKSIIGSGIYMLDKIVKRSYPEWPKMRPFTEESVIEEVGGTCGNVMCILSWLGWDAMPQVCLDESEEGFKMKSDLISYGCDPRFVTNSPDGGTTILRCTHKKNPDGSPSVSFRAGSPGGSRFPKRHFLRVKDEAPAFLGKLEEAPGVYFFDDPAAGHRLIAKELREKGSLVYFEPSKISTNADMDAVKVSDIVKFSGENVPDCSFTEVFDDKLFIQTLGADGLRFRLRQGDWVSVQPVHCDNVVDWEGAGDWTTSAFLTRIASLDMPFTEMKEEDIKEALQVAQIVAAQSVCFLSSKGMIREASKQKDGDIRAIMNRKEIRSNFSDSAVTFVPSIEEAETEKSGAYSDGILLLDRDAEVEDDIQQMHLILRSGSPVNMEDFYRWFGAFDDDSRFERMVTALGKDR
ncbi:MAG: hypothetical protein IJ584_09890 [Bacteroidales bacterium]|nr:hypothetical protein [Bacteroidales bacterium]